MIVGVGIDLVPISRIAASLDRFGGRFEARIFTERERAFCRQRALPAQHFAARFAAKEAVLKALGVPAGLAWHEMEIVANDNGAPTLKLSGKALALARHVSRWHLSLTHAGDTAAAFVVAESL